MRLREDPGHRWDHWWLATIDTDEGVFPAGALVSTVLREDAAGFEGSYVDYIGVHRRARGRGVAKALLHTVIADAARRGRNRVGLEVDADSPTGADGLYTSMGWVTDYRTQSWHRELDLPLTPRTAAAGLSPSRRRRRAGSGCEHGDLEGPLAVAHADEGLPVRPRTRRRRDRLREDGAGDRRGGGVRAVRRAAAGTPTDVIMHLEVGVAGARRRRRRCRRPWAGRRSAPGRSGRPVPGNCHTTRSNPVWRPTRTTPIAAEVAAEVGERRRADLVEREPGRHGGRRRRVARCSSGTSRSARRRGRGGAVVLWRTRRHRGGLGRPRCSPRGRAPAKDSTASVRRWRCGTGA